MTASELAQRLEGRRNGSGWAARCPAHDDRHASLSVGEGDDGRALLKCHAGCSLSAVLGKLSLREVDLFPTRDARATRPARILKTTRYEIRDAAGVLQAIHVREDFSNGSKRFIWQRPDGTHGLNGTPVATLPLYGAERLARLPREAGVILTEGEKAAEAVRSLRLPAVATVTGAGGCPGPTALELLRERRVFPWLDADAPGRAHMDRVAKALAGIAAEVRLLTWGAPGSKADAADFVAAGGTREQLIELVKAAPKWEPTTMNENGEEAPAPREAMPAQNQRRPRKGRAIELDDPEPADEAVNGATLLDDIAALLGEYVVLPTGAAQATALWIAHTYLMDIWDVTPLLALSSPTKRCGKTTLLRVIGRLVHRPLSASGISAAAIFRTVEDCEPTLLIDEMDAMRDNEDLRAVLNAGHTRDLAFVVRVVGEGANMEPRRFSVWCPKVLAHIGRLPGTLEDRAIRIQMRRKLAGEKRERIRRRKLEALLAPIRRRLARWAEDATEDLRTREPEIPEPLDDRAADNWEPLLALADAAGERWPQLAREVAVSLSVERGDDERDENPGLLVLADLRELMESGKVEIEAGVAGDDACTALRDLSERPWKTWGRGRDGLQSVHLARLLRPFGCVPKQMRIDGKGGRRRYPAEALAEAFARYLASAVTPATPATASDPLQIKPHGSTSVAGVAGVAGLAECSGSEAVTVIERGEL